jgi:serine protease Do
VSQIREVLGLKVFQIDAPISPGSSGGPLLDSHFRVVGIVTAYMREGQNLNFAIPINYARGMLDRDKVKYSK